MYYQNKYNGSSCIRGTRCFGPNGKIWSCALLFMLPLVFADPCNNETLTGCPVVNIRLGPIIGTWSKSVSGRKIKNYFGIPYAEPPIKELRFNSPKKWNRYWSEPLIAHKEKPNCPHEEYLLSGASEDCLYLNVHVPDDLRNNLKTLNSGQNNSKTLVPVLVLVHGVPYIEGNGHSKLYNPKYLLEKDVVLVTLNYRVSILGFWTTGNQVAPGNYGLKDIVMVLKWIQENIVDFNGDPDSVTLMGSSAGSEMVHLLALSYKTEGLFHKYILISGSALSPWSMRRYDWLKYRETCLKTADWVQNCLVDATKNKTIKYNILYDNDFYHDNVTQNRDDIYNNYVYWLMPKNRFKNLKLQYYWRMADCMRNADVHKLMDLSDNLKTKVKNLEFHYGPTLEIESEDAILTMHPAKILKEGLFRDIPAIMLVMNNAGLTQLLQYHLLAQYAINHTIMNTSLYNFERLLPYMLEYQDMIADTPQLAEAVKTFYFNGNLTRNALQSNINQVAGDATIIWPMFKALKYQSKLGESDIYLFHLGYEGTFSFTLDCDIQQRDSCLITRIRRLLDLWDTDVELRPANYTFIDEKQDDIMALMSANLLLTFVTKGEIQLHSTMRVTNNCNYAPYVRIGNGKMMNITVESYLLEDKMHFWNKLMPKVLKEVSVYLTL